MVCGTVLARRNYPHKADGKIHPLEDERKGGLTEIGYYLVLINVPL
jgi:hypothetical protein